MTCRLIDPPLQSKEMLGEEQTIQGRVCILGVEMQVPFRISLICADRDFVELHATASINRFDFGICPYWPTFTLGKDLTLDAVLVAGNSSAAHMPHAAHVSREGNKSTGLCCSGPMKAMVSAVRNFAVSICNARAASKGSK